jgi:hypothetical protein
MRDATIENSRALTIVNTNLKYGFNAKPRPVKRYRPVHIATYLSTFGSESLRMSSDDSDDGTRS